MTLLDAREAAAVAEVTVATVWKWVQRGYLKPAAKRGRQHLYHWRDVMRVEAETSARDTTGRANR